MLLSQQQQQQAPARASCCQQLYPAQDLYQWQQQQQNLMLNLRMKPVAVLRVGLLQSCCCRCRY
jgi:hypothetical protein